jgi:hypothetical protein
MNPSYSQDTISTPELAKKLGISRQRVNELGRMGKIQREADGQWNLERVHAAIERNLYPGQRRALAGPSFPVARGKIERLELYERIRDGLQRLPAVLLDAHPAVPVWVVLAAVDAFDLVLGSIVLDIDEDLIADDQVFPAAQPNYRELVESRGIVLTSQQWAAAEAGREAFISALDAALWPDSRYCSEIA